MLCCVWVKGVLCFSKAFFVCVVSLSYDEPDETERAVGPLGSEQEKGKENETQGRTEMRLSFIIY